MNWCIHKLSAERDCAESQSQQRRWIALPMNRNMPPLIFNGLLRRPRDRLQILTAAQTDLLRCLLGQRPLRASSRVRASHLHLWRSPSFVAYPTVSSVGISGSRPGRGRLGTWQDITKRKQAEEELRASAIRFQKLIEVNPVPCALNNATSNKA